MTEPTREQIDAAINGDYTPGPWQMSHIGGAYQHVIHTDGGGLLAKTPITTAKGHDENEANARLIAAAPDLAAALRAAEAREARLRVALNGIENTPPTDLAMVRSEAYWLQIVRDMMQQAKAALSQEDT